MSGRNLLRLSPVLPFVAFVVISVYPVCLTLGLCPRIYHDTLVLYAFYDHGNMALYLPLLGHIIRLPGNMALYLPILGHILP